MIGGQRFCPAVMVSFSLLCTVHSTRSPPAIYSLPGWLPVLLTCIISGAELALAVIATADLCHK